MNNCSLCGKLYEHRNGLFKHQRLKHNIIREKSTFQCYTCKTVFAKKTELIVHLKTAHKPDCKRNIKRLRCAVRSCETMFQSFASYHKHLKHNHRLHLEESIYKLEDMTKFEEWKTQVEEEQKVMYVRDSGVKQVANGEKRSYYFCHRSGVSRHVKLPKRNTKTCGSNKIGRTCPAMMVVTTKRNQVILRICSTHIGHTGEISRMQLSTADKNQIARKLAEGVPIDRVLQDIRDKTNLEEIKRIDLTKKKDIYNIQRDISARLHSASAPTIELEVKASVAELEDNPTLHHKQQEIEDSYDKHNENGTKQEMIKNKLELIINLNNRSDVSERSRLVVCKYLDKIISIMDRGITVNCKKNVNMNKNVEPQVRFYSTGKTPVSNFEATLVKEELVSVGSQNSHVHCSFDHSYAVAK